LLRSLKKIIGKYVIVKWKTFNFAQKVKSKKNIFVIVGAAKTRYEGWIATNRDFFDLTNRNIFKKLFKDKKMNKVLAEHVFEHLSHKDLKNALYNIYIFMEKGGNLRIAVPDGFHKDKKYIDAVKPGGNGIGADDHKHLFTYKSLGNILKEVGFDVNMIEYWDENKNFHSCYQNDENGVIQRAYINDSRNSDGIPNYTSLIVDAVKKYDA
jgi:predicted SAM-dependent methyltransferase